MKEIKLDELDDSIRFRIRLEISLRDTAIRIKKLNGSTTRFDEYIKAREMKIQDLLKLSDGFYITEEGKRIYP